MITTTPLPCENTELPTMLPVIDNYREILTAATPLLDVRAPGEFHRGHLPAACNVPLLVDDERHRVGLCYRHHGQQAAIALGNQLVCGAGKATRINAWRQMAEREPATAIYCFRGGLRSRIAQQWLHDETGNAVPRIAGGYKALRAFVTRETSRLCSQQSFMLLGGQTGVGKTELLSQLPHHIDLEALANHRGSAFGGLPNGQPAPASFELALGVALLRLTRVKPKTVLLEHEGRMIGALGLPKSLIDAMNHSRIVVLRERFDARVARINQDYIDRLFAACRESANAARVHQTTDSDFDIAFDDFSKRLQQSLTRIRKRLGNARYEICRRFMAHALQAQRQQGSTELHREWIQYLLREYYDPMYDYQLQSNRDRIEYEGDRDAVAAWVAAAQMP